MKKLLFAFLLIVLLLSVTSCNLSQGTRTLPAPKTASPTIPPLLTATPSPAAAGSATPKAGLTNSAPSKTVPANTTPAKTTPSPAASPTQPKPAAPPTATVDPTYPDNPDGVAQAFVTGYPDNTAEMLRYLSSSLKAALPSGAPAVLLKIQGDINGFAIISGSQASNSSEAQVVAAMLAGGKQVQRTFLFIKENNRWVINRID